MMVTLYYFVRPSFVAFLCDSFGRTYNYGIFQCDVNVCEKNMRRRCIFAAVL
jgi:hypothetical protein